MCGKNWLPSQFSRLGIQVFRFCVYVCIYVVHGGRGGGGCLCYWVGFLFALLVWYTHVVSCIILLHMHHYIMKCSSFFHYMNQTYTASRNSRMGDHWMLLAEFNCHLTQLVKCSTHPSRKYIYNNKHSILGQQLHNCTLTTNKVNCSLFYSKAGWLLLNCLHMGLHLGEIKGLSCHTFVDIHNIITCGLKVCSCII